MIDLYSQTGRQRQKMNTGIFLPIKENKKVFILSFSSIVLIVLSLYSSMFALAALILNIYAIISLPSEKSIVLLASLMPWAYVYKYSGIPTSLFSIIVFIAVIKYLFDIRRIDARFIVVLLLFIINVLFHFKLNDRTMQLMFVKLIFNLLLLYEMCVIHKSENFSAILVFFIFSVIFSSIIAITIPNRALLANRIRQEGLYVEFQYERFKGLQNDPNYYNSSLIICLLFLCYLFIQKKANSSFFILSLACIYFGVLTYSKSFFVMLLLWIGVVICYAFTNKRYLLSFFLAGIGVLSVLLLFSGRIQAVNVLLNRFTDSSGVTSGRVEIWGLFLQHFRESPLALLFGNGFESLIYQTHASHNTYIDMIYYFGVVGALLFSYLIRICIKQRETKRKHSYAIVFLVFVFGAYFFLSGITMCELPFLLFFVFMFFSHNENEIYEEAEQNLRIKRVRCKYVKESMYY